jgi:septum formation topological specificity factor MinE
MVFLVETGNGDIIERMWRLLVSARRNDDNPHLWRLTDDILDTVCAFYRISRDNATPSVPNVTRFLDIPVDPTTTAPHLLCYPNVIYHL